MSIEELREKCLLLGHTTFISGDRNLWYLTDDSRQHPNIIKARGGFFGRLTEREVLEETLQHYGIPL